jgi:hypothetical protein
MSRQGNLLIIKGKINLEKKKWEPNIPRRGEAQVNNYKLSIFQQSSSNNHDSKM